MKHPFQLGDTGDDPHEFRVVVINAENTVVGDFMFDAMTSGDSESGPINTVRVTVRRFDEAEFGSLEVVIV